MISAFSHLFNLENNILAYIFNSIYINIKQLKNKKNQKIVLFYNLIMDFEEIRSLRGFDFLFFIKRSSLETNDSDRAVYIKGNSVHIIDIGKGTVINSTYLPCIPKTIFYINSLFYIVTVINNTEKLLVFEINQRYKILKELNNNIFRSVYIHEGRKVYHTDGSFIYILNVETKVEEKIDLKDKSISNIEIIAVFSPDFLGGTTNSIFINKNNKEKCITDGINEIPVKTSALDIKYVDEVLYFIYNDGSAFCVHYTKFKDLLNNIDSQKRQVFSPNNSIIIDTTGQYYLSNDGAVFEPDKPGEVQYVMGAQRLFQGKNILVITKNTAYKQIKKDTDMVFSNSLFPHRFPFCNNFSMILENMFYSYGHRINSFNLSTGQTTEFAKLIYKSEIRKITVFSHLIAVKFIYENVKKLAILSTFSSEIYKEFEALDSCYSTQEECQYHWVLTKNSLNVYGYDIKLHRIREREYKIANHKYDRIVSTGAFDMVFMYKTITGGIAFFVNDYQELEKKTFIPGIIDFNWPAFYTKKNLYICKHEEAKQATFDKLSNFICIEHTVNSMCWLGRTLFYSSGGYVYAVGRKSRIPRRIIQLRTVHSQLLQVFPYSILVLEKTLSSANEVVTVSVPAILECIPDLVSSSCKEEFARLLDLLKESSIDPNYVLGMDPLWSFSLFMKIQPSYINDDVIMAYQVVGKFRELGELARKLNSRVKKVGQICFEFGQFEEARKCFSHCNNYKGLFELFILLKSQRNLALLASKLNCSESMRHLTSDTTTEGDYDELYNHDFSFSKDVFKKDIISPQPSQIGDGSTFDYKFSGINSHKISPVECYQEAPEHKLDVSMDFMIPKAQLNQEEVVTPTKTEEVDPETIFDQENDLYKNTEQLKGFGSSDDEDELGKFFKDDEQPVKKKRLKFGISMPDTTGMDDMDMNLGISFSSSQNNDVPVDEQDGRFTSNINLEIN